MQVRNGTSRFHLEKEVFEKMAERKVISEEKAKTLTEKYDGKLAEHSEYIKKFGVDMEEIENWVWQN